VANSDIWGYIGSERSALADTWDTLTAEQWSSPSWCEHWSVKEVAGHVLAAAEQTPRKFFKELSSARFKFDVFTERGAERNSALEPTALARRLRARTTTRNHPPGPSSAMLGEIIVHGDDIRRPLGLTHHSPEPALLIVADAWSKSDLLIGSKSRVKGLRLVATDATWTHGDGPEVLGPLQTLLLAMTGRAHVLGELSGDGVPVLSGRSTR
jgi:uncharacterized protein (TIGR03083 family)